MRSLIFLYNIRWRVRIVTVRGGTRSLVLGVNMMTCTPLRIVLRVQRGEHIHAIVFHRMCKHRGVKAMERMAQYMGVKIVGTGWRERIMRCEYCLKNKIKRAPHFKGNHHRVEHQPGIHISMDTQGWWNTLSWDGKKYKFTVKCLASNFELDYYLRHKNEFLPCFLKAVSFFERHTGTKLKFITCDQEYGLYKGFQSWLDESQVVLLEAPTGEKQAVSKVERSHQTNGGPARALLSDAELPQSFWTEMEKNATYINNLLPISRGPFRGKSPYEVLHNRKPYLHHLRPVGCVAVMKVKVRRGQGERGRKVVFLGYERDTGYYRVYDPIKHTIHGNVRDVSFDVWKLGKREARKDLDGISEPMFSVKWHETPSHDTSDNCDPNGSSSQMGVQGPSATTQPSGESPVETIRVTTSTPTEHVTSSRPHFISHLESKDKQDVDSHPITYSPNYDHLPELEPPSPTVDSRGSTAVEGEKEVIIHRKGKVKSRPKERTILSGKQVRVPARMWGEGWARSTYGDQWESIERKGITLGPTAPIVRRTKRFPAHHVLFDDGVTDKMVDSEIIKYSCISEDQVADQVADTGPEQSTVDPNTFAEFGSAEGERLKVDKEKDKHGRNWRSHAQGEISEENVIKNRTRHHISVCAKEERVDYCLVSEQTPDFPVTQKPKDRRQAREKEVKQQEELNAFEWRQESEARKSGSPIIPLKWIDTVKQQGTPEEFHKARVTLRGDLLREGVQYDSKKTYSPTAHHRTILIIVAYAASMGINLWLIDFTTAYLHAKMPYDIYVKPPPGFERKGYVWLLKKALYGHPESGRLWYDMLAHELITKQGFSTLTLDKASFVKFNKGPKSTQLISFHVDDGIHMATQGEHEALVDSLGKHKFRCKDLGKATEFKNIQIVQTEKGILLHQRKYELLILKELGYLGGIPAKTPFTSENPSPLKQGHRLLEYDLRCLIGMLIFLAVHTRPLLICPLSIAAKSQVPNPSLSYAMLHRMFLWVLTPRALFFRKGDNKLLRFITNAYKLPITPKSWGPARGPSAASNAISEINLLESKTLNSFSVPVIANMDRGLPVDPLVGFVDSDFAGEKTRRKSRSGFIFLFNGAPIAWFSKLQPVIAQSTLEAETVSANEAVRELLAIRQTMRDVGLSTRGPTILFEDNEGTLLLSERGLGESRTKHIEVKYHFVHKLVKSGIVKLMRVASEENVADIFTKTNFTQDKFNYFANKISLKLDGSNMTRFGITSAHFAG